MSFTRQNLRWSLLAAGWLLTFLALPLHACTLNGFMGWQGSLQTFFFLRWVFQLPAHLLREFPTAGLGYAQDLLWLTYTLLGLALLAFAPILIHRIRRTTAITALRCLAPTMLLTPATLLIPHQWHFPLPGPGLWMVAAAQLLVFFALILVPRPAPTADHAFPLGRN